MTRGRDKFMKYSFLFKALSKVYSIFPRAIREWLFVQNRNTPGNWGLIIRYALLRTLAIFIGDNVSIHQGVFLFNTQALSIGNNVSIHPMCYIEAWGGVSIGNDVSIAHAVSVLSVNHKFANLNMPIKDQGLEPKPVHIENDVWIGAKATILGGVVVQTGSIVAAGAVVTRNVEAFSIVAGVPAKALHFRT